MQIRWNPFVDIIQTKTQPHSKTLRITLLRKILETFAVLHGNNDELNTRNGELYIGIFDYLTLFMQYWPIKLLSWSNQHRNSSLLADLLYYPLQGWDYLFSAFRILFAVLGTLVALPIVAMVHAIVCFAGREEINDTAMSLKGFAFDADGQILNAYTTLGQALNQTLPPPTLPGAVLTHSKRYDMQPIEDPNERFHVEVIKDAVVIHDDSTYVPIKPTPVFQAPIQPDQKAAFNALLRLNFANFTTCCEDHNLLPQFEFR